MNCWVRVSFAASQVTSKNSKDKKLKRNNPPTNRTNKANDKTKNKKEKGRKISNREYRTSECEEEYAGISCSGHQITKGLILWSYHKTKRKHKNLTKS